MSNYSVASHALFKMHLKVITHFFAKLLICINVLNLGESATTNDSLSSPTCYHKKSRTSDALQFKCRNLRTLQKYLDKAQLTTTEISVRNSNIQTIPGHAFIRLASSLKIVDLHLCGIEVVDPQAFVGLVKLEKLILWGNKLNWVAAVWFTNLQNLRVLDLSFNRIENIEYKVYQMLPNLENLFIDYNNLKAIPFDLFLFLTKLKKVKFGMNPLSWSFRVLLTWQLVYQKVEYQDDWENWDWFSDVARDCLETGQGSMASDQLLDCVSLKLVHFASDKMLDLSNSTSNISCSQEVSSLLRCVNADQKNQTQGESVRKALQGMDTILQHMEFSLGKFGTA